MVKDNEGPGLPGFVRRALIEYPKSKNTADYSGEAEADDGHKYFLKGDKLGHYIRASEWIGTRLAETVGIAAPSCAVIQRMNGELAFGSRKIMGLVNDVETMNFLMAPTLSNSEGRPVGLSGILSAIYAYDLFIFNDDRHLGNYLSVDDNGTRRFYAFDFSRAVFWKWPWDGVPPSGNNTRVYGSILFRTHGFDTIFAHSVLDRLGALTGQDMQKILDGMPSSWLAPDRRGEFIGWWDGPGKIARVDDIKKGVKNGTYL